MVKRVTRKSELIVRELSIGVNNLVALAPNITEVQDNVARFFNDTPYNLDLVAIRIGTLVVAKTNGTMSSAFAVVEVSRQAIAGQQEGIIANQRSMVSVPTVSTTLATPNFVKGEMLFGDFKTPLTTLEVQETLFMHSVISNFNVAGGTFAIGDINHAMGATLYFRVKSSGY